MGDSPLFLVRDREIVLPNEDHSLAPEIDKLAARRQDQLDGRARRSAPAFPALGLDGPNRSGRPLASAAGAAAGRRVLLASDGIHTVSHADIARVVGGADSPAGVADGLLAAVEAAGDPHQDNNHRVVVRSRVLAAVMESGRLLIRKLSSRAQDALASLQVDLAKHAQLSKRSWLRRLRRCAACGG